MRASRRCLLAVPAALTTLLVLAAPGLAGERDAMVEVTVAQGEEVTRTIEVPEALAEDLEGARIGIHPAGAGGAAACARFTMRPGKGGIEAVKVNGMPKAITVTVKAVAGNGNHTAVGDHSCTLALTIKRPGQKKLRATITFVLHVEAAKPGVKPGAKPGAKPTPMPAPVDGKHDGKHDGKDDGKDDGDTPAGGQEAVTGEILPFTGARTPLLLTVGGALLAAGGALVTTTRRRRAGRHAR